MSADHDARAEVLAALAKSRAFSHLAPEKFQQIVGQSAFRRFPQGSLILQEGQPNSEVFLLLKGSVSVYSGGMLVGRYGRAGDTFGEMSVVSGSPASATVVANDGVEVLVLDVSAFQEFHTGSDSELEALYFKLFAFSLLEKLRLTTLKARLAEDAILRVPSFESAELNTIAATEEVAKHLNEILLVSRAIHMADRAIVVTDAEGRIVRINLAAEKLLACIELEVAGHPLEEIFESGGGHSIVTRLIAGTISRWEGEMRLRKRNDTAFPARVSLATTLDAKGQCIGLLMAADDLTEWNALQSRLEHAQKLEIAGRMAGGFAHDLNNLLQPIVGYSQLLLEQAPAQSHLHRQLQMVATAADRAADLVSQFVLFSGQSRIALRRLSVTDTMEQCLRLVRATQPERITIRQSIAPGLPDVMGDETQLQRVLTNLATNARHAMPGTGVLGLHAETVTLDDALSLSGVQLSGRYVRLTVSDTGTGIEPDVLERMWEPFFTTRKPGEGTGLGLAVVSEIVKQHNGGIQVQSTPGQGTTFQIYLPAVDAGAAPRRSDAAAAAKGERILFVDDEEIVCSLVKTVLERAGYQVHTETQGASALDAFRDPAAGFDLVITDLSMQPMRGDELVRHLREIQPRIPIIMCTGNLTSGATDTEPLTDVDELIYKPIRPNQLCLCVRRVLDRAAASS